MISILTVAALLGAAPPQAVESLAAQAPEFAAPIRLLAGEQPLGGKLLYPSPRLYDIDQDGESELVVADLMGRVQVAEKVGDDPATWSALEPFISCGQPLKFHNW